MIKAAGILYVTKDGQALYLKRGPGSDHPGEWCFPGGHVEPGETALQAAEREADEELGAGTPPPGTKVPWTRTISPPTLPPVEQPVPGQEANAEATVDFTTFLQRVDDTFTPQLNGEHTGWSWAPIDQPPEPLHPGCRVALERFQMDELGVAKAIRDGKLMSPQRYENLSLYAMRITGTGTAYRKALDEYVYRAPENYLSAEFLERCNGLPVIFQHPDKRMMDSEEFADRVVGTIMLAYIKGDEVWGIAKVYDDGVIEMMEKQQLSTSPSVVFRDPSVNSTMELDNGATLLIEGKPSLLDHLAICEQGVWDKGGKPAGIEAGNIGEQSMTDEEKAAEKARQDAAARADAEAGEKLDKVLTCMDSFGKGFDALTKRMDAMEEELKADRSRKDAEGEEKPEPKEGQTADLQDKGKPTEIAADKARKDGEEEDKVSKADAEELAKVKADSVELRQQIAELTARLPRQMSDQDFAQMADVQAKADSVFSAFGERAPRPLDGETVNGYRRRMAGKLKVHSPSWSKVDVAVINDGAAFDEIEKHIYNDAMVTARSPADVPDGNLREIISTDSTGRRISSFVGQPNAWMGEMSGHRRRLAGIRNKGH